MAASCAMRPRSSRRRRRHGAQHARAKGGGGARQNHCCWAEATPKRAPTQQERRWLRIACYVYYGIGMQASQCLNTSCACDSAFFNRACEVQPGRARAGRWHPCIQPDARDATTGSTRASNRMRAMLPTLHRQTAVSVGSARPPPTRVVDGVGRTGEKMATNRMLCVLWNWDASIPMPKYIMRMRFGLLQQSV